MLSCLKKLVNMDNFENKIRKLIKQNENQNENQQAKPLDTDGLTDMVNTWFNMDPFFATIVLEALKKCMRVRILEMKAYIGDDLQSWTGHEWSDAEYVHLFVMELACSVECAFVWDTETSGTIYLDLPQKSREYSFNSEDEVVHLCTKIVNKISKVIAQSFQIKWRYEDPSATKARKIAYLYTIKATVGIDSNDRIKNGNLDYVRGLSINL